MNLWNVSAWLSLIRQVSRGDKRHRRRTGASQWCHRKYAARTSFKNITSFQFIWIEFAYLLIYFYRCLIFNYVSDPWLKVNTIKCVPEIPTYKNFNVLQPDQQWKVDLEDLENQIDDDTAAIVVINPSNPCGSVYNKQHLHEIVDIAERNQVPIIADEIYEHFVFSGHESIAISSISKNVPVLTCSGLTKRFLVPGWRMGWVIIHDRHNILGKEIRQALANLSNRILGPNTLIQRALPSILKDTPQSFFDEVVLFIEVSGRFHRSGSLLHYNFISTDQSSETLLPIHSVLLLTDIYTYTLYLYLANLH